MDNAKARACWQKGVDALAQWRRDPDKFETGPADALAAFDTAIELAPDDANAWHWRGVALAALRRNEEALTAYDEALRLDPREYGARRSKAELLEGLGRSAEAAFAAGMNWTVLSTTADHLSDLREELGEALAAFEQAVALKPDYVDAWYWKGEILAQLDRDDAAVAAYDEALRRRPKSANMWLRKANALARLRRNEEALAAYDEVLRLDPGNADARIGKRQVSAKRDR